MSQRKTPTIRDVAAKAGVSVATVSRVLNRKSNVRADTGERVQAAARELGFQPSVQARSMRAPSPLIGLVMGPRLPPYVSEVEWGVAGRCRAEGYHLVVGAYDPDAEAAADAARGMIASLDMAGMVLFPPMADDPDMLALLRETGLACARLSAEDAPDIPTVRTDETGAARTITGHLIELGHRDIAFIEGHPAHRAAALRREGYEAALAEAGLTARAEWIAPGLFDFESGRAAAATLLAGAQRPTAILAANDSSALGAMSAAKEAGLRVPDDLSIAGFDDVPAASRVWPALTTMRQGIREIAEEAAGLIFARLAGTAPEAGAEHPSAQFELVVRGSTAPPPA